MWGQEAMRSEHFTDFAPVRSLFTGLLCCMEISHRAGRGWGATAGIQALPDGQDSGGRTGVLSTPIPRYVLPEPSL